MHWQSEILYFDGNCRFLVAFNVVILGLVCLLVTYRSRKLWRAFLILEIALLRMAGADLVKNLIVAYFQIVAKKSEANYF